MAGGNPPGDFFRPVDPNELDQGVYENRTQLCNIVKRRDMRSVIGYQWVIVLAIPNEFRHVAAFDTGGSAMGVFSLQDQDGSVSYNQFVVCTGFPFIHIKFFFFLLIIDLYLNL